LLTLGAFPSEGIVARSHFPPRVRDMARWGSPRGTDDRTRRPPRGFARAPAASPHAHPTVDEPGAPKCVTDLLDSRLRAEDCYTPAMADERPKTAYELAMERLAQKDKAAGGAAAPPSREGDQGHC